LDHHYHYHHHHHHSTKTQVETTELKKHMLLEWRERTTWEKIPATNHFAPKGLWKHEVCRSIVPGWSFRCAEATDRHILQRFFCVSHDPNLPLIGMPTVLMRELRFPIRYGDMRTDSKK
jgi:hypothetical protein